MVFSISEFTFFFETKSKDHLILSYSVLALQPALLHISFIETKSLWSYHYDNLGFVTHSGVIVKLPSYKGW